MAAHAQQQILEMVRDGLAAAAIVAPGHVYLDRFDPLTLDDLPAITVEEGPQGETSGPAKVGGSDERTFPVLVKAVVAAGDGSPAAARELGKRIEQVLGARGFVAPKASRLRLSISRHNNWGEGAAAVSAREQIWLSTYFTRRDEPDQPF